MTTHSLQLATIPFEAIKNNKKVIESRLFDEKRRLINLGDSIEFVNRVNPENKITVEVIGLLRFKSFEELFTNNNPSLFGGESVDWLLNQIHEYYSPEQEKQYGVLGILFKNPLR